MKNLPAKDLLKNLISIQSSYARDSALECYWKWKTLAFKSMAPRTALNFLQEMTERIPEDLWKTTASECDSRFHRTCGVIAKEVRTINAYFPKDDALEAATWFFLYPASNVLSHKEININDPTSFLTVSMQFKLLSILWKRFAVIAKKFKVPNSDIFNKLVAVSHNVDAGSFILIGACRYKKEFADQRTRKATEAKQASMGERKKAVLDAYNTSFIGKKKMTLHRVALNLTEELRAKYPNLKTCSLNTIKKILREEGLITKT